MGDRFDWGPIWPSSQIDGREAPTTVLVGKVDEPILGVEALEALGLIVDPAKKRLSPSRPYAVRLGGYRCRPYAVRLGGYR